LCKEISCCFQKSKQTGRGTLISESQESNYWKVLAFKRIAFFVWNRGMKERESIVGIITMNPIDGKIDRYVDM
jgi:hypothetical protein